MMTWEDDSAKWFLEKLETDLDDGSKAALKARLDNPDMVLVAVPKDAVGLVADWLEVWREHKEPRSILAIKVEETGGGE